MRFCIRKERIHTEFGAKLKPRVFIAAGLLVGVLLLWLGASVRRAEKDETSPESAPGDSAAAVREWCAYLEDEAVRLCESVAGVSRVTVVVTVSESFVTRCAADETVRGDERTKKVVTVGSGSAARLYETGLTMPVIAGIGVSCRGAEDPGTRAELTALLSAAFGVGINKIYVTGAD